MIDLKGRLTETMAQVKFYGSWLTYGGLVIIVASILTFIVEFLRLTHFARLPQLKGDNKMGQLEDKLDDLYEKNEEQLSTSNAWQKLSTDVEAEKAVLMGNKESIIFVYMLNCVACILFLIMGILMWRAAKPSLQMVDFVERGGIQNVPDDLKRRTGVDSFIQQRNKFKYCIYVSLFCFMLIFLSTFVRLMVTYDTEQMEAKILSKLETTDQNNPNLRDEAQEQADQHLTDAEQDNYSKILHHSNHRESLLMLEDDQGQYPNLWIAVYFAFLVCVMLLNLYNFGKFQKYQEKMSANVEDIEMKDTHNIKLVEQRVE